MAVAGNEVQPLADLFEEVLHRRGWALGDRQPADVHVGLRTLLVQEGGVDRSEPVEVALGHQRVGYTGRPYNGGGACHG